MLASAALAVPSSNDRLAARLERRREGRQSQPLKVVDPSSLVPLTTNTSHVEYSSNWAGCVLNDPAVFIV